MEMSSYWQNFSSLAAPEVVKMTISRAASDEKFLQYVNNSDSVSKNSYWRHPCLDLMHHNL